MNKDYQEYRNKLKETLRRKRYKYYIRNDRAHHRKKAIIDLGYYVGCGGSGMNIYSLDTSLDNNLDLYDAEVFGFNVETNVTGGCSAYHCAPEPLSKKYVDFLLWLSHQPEFINHSGFLNDFEREWRSESSKYTQEFYEIRNICCILTLKEKDMLYLMPNIEKYISSKEYKNLLQKTKELLKEFNS